MYPIPPKLHNLVTDAGDNVRAVADSYPAWIQGEYPGYYYRLVSLDIVPCGAVSDRWRTLSQWEGLLGLYGTAPDGLGTS